jgi:putative ABC transport system permease protein
VSRKRLVLRLLLRAAWVRKDRALTTLISVAVAATIATAALTVYYDLENKLTREFRSFGANIVVTAQNRALSHDELTTIKSALGGHGTIVPVAYAIVTGPNDTRLVLGGADLKSLRELNSWWAVHQIDSQSGDALLGSQAAEKLAPQGQAFTVQFGKNELSIHPAETFSSGSEDDSRIYVSLPDFLRLTGIQPNTALMRAEGKPAELQATAERLSASLPGIEVKPIRQITQAQTTVLGKTKSVVLAASAVVLLLIALCMASTFSGSVLERRRDFAVMKALGASNRAVNSLFAAEASLLGIAGAIIGYVLGCGIAFWIGKANFNAAILPSAWLFLPILLGSILLALVASTVPLRTLQQVQPAGILRGE